MCYGSRTKRSTLLYLGSPDGFWPSSSHAPIPQSDWSQTVLTENPSLCACLLVCVCGGLCVLWEREGCIWMTAKLNARANEATGSQWERWGQDIAGSGREMLALSPAVTHGQTVSGGVCNWLSFNMSLDEESVVLEERKGGDAGRLFPWWDGPGVCFTLPWCMHREVGQ